MRRPSRRARAGSALLLIWARGLDGERVWALEDCRHVAGSFERFLIARGERVLRVPTKLMADSRRRRDARQVRQHRRDRRRPRRAGAKESTRCRPRTWTGPSSICGCWSITANAWSASASRSTTRSNGTCTICGPNSSCPAARCSRPSGAPGSAGASRAPSRPCASGSPATSCAACANSPHSIRALEAEIAQLVAQVAPQLLCRARVRAAHRGQARRRDRRRRPLRLRRQARPRRRPRPDPGQLRQDQPTPARPRRQPPDQRRDPPHRDHPRALPPRNPRLHRPQALRRQDAPRRHPLAQAPPRPPHLAPAATARAPPGPDDHTHFFDIGAAKAAVAPVRGCAARAGCSFRAKQKRSPGGSRQVLPGTSHLQIVSRHDGRRL